MTINFNDLSVAYQKRIKTIYTRQKEWLKGNKIITLDDLSWIDKFNDKLIKWVELAYKNPESQKGMLLALRKASNEDNQEKLGKLTKVLGDINHKKASENKLEGKELCNWKTYEELVAIREQMRTEWENDKTNKLKNMRYLIACLYTMTPPLRSEWRNMKITSEVEDDNKNYLIGSDKAYLLYINNDKVSNIHEPLAYKLPSKLTKIIVNSLKYFPREYVLEPPTRTRVGQEGMSYNKLNDMMVKDLGFNIDNARSAYITMEYKKPNKSHADKAELAKRMRHSIGAASIHYNKVDNILSAQQSECGDSD